MHYQRLMAENSPADEDRSARVIWGNFSNWEVNLFKISSCVVFTLWVFKHVLNTQKKVFRGLLHLQHLAMCNDTRNPRSAKVRLIWPTLAESDSIWQQTWLSLCVVVRLICYSHGKTAMTEADQSDNSIQIHLSSTPPPTQMRLHTSHSRFMTVL